MGAIAYKAVVDGELLGGALVVINGDHGHLDFLYVKSGTQNLIHQNRFVSYSQA